MSHYKHWWYPNISRALKAYPSLIAKKDELRKQNIIAKYSPDPRAGGTSRATENIALKDLPPAEAALVDAIESALDEISRRRDGEYIVRLIDLVSFRQTHTIQGAAAVLNMSEKTARRRHGDFIILTARKLGYMQIGQSGPKICDNI